MDILMGAHIAGGGVALVAGALALFARKGGRLHARAGIAFAVAMLFLWLSATALHLRDGKTDAAIGDLFIGYFVVTSWLAARRRDGTTGRIEIAACALIFATGSFFLGQQDALPEAARGSPVLVVLAFAPFAALAFWMVRLRFGKRLKAAVQALSGQAA